MKTMLLLCLAIPIFMLSATARNGNPEPHGFVRMLNAVSMGSGPLHFSIDGSSIRDGGYHPGNVTGGIALKPGAYRMSFRREGVKEGETRIQIVADDTTILIPFAEEVPATQDEPAHWAIRILRLKQHEAADHRVATFVSVSRQPEIRLEMRQSNLEWERHVVRRLEITRTPIKQSKGYVPVRSGEIELSAISVGPSGNYVSVLYDDEKGILKSRTFQDYKYLSAD